MKIMRNIFWVVLMMIVLATGVEATAQETHTRKEGAYLVVEGSVSMINARMLVIDGQQYPVSMFARVFQDTLRGRELSLQTMANVGKIDLARLYILGGKVEKIVVIKNL
jgi:hypothetical protein